MCVGFSRHQIKRKESSHSLVAKYGKSSIAGRSVIVPVSGVSVAVKIKLKNVLHPHLSNTGAELALHAHLAVATVPAVCIVGVVCLLGQSRFFGHADEDIPPVADVDHDLPAMLAVAYTSRADHG